MKSKNFKIICNVNHQSTLSHIYHISLTHREQSPCPSTTSELNGDLQLWSTVTTGLALSLVIPVTISVLLPLNTIRTPLLSMIPAIRYYTYNVGETKNKSWREWNINVEETKVWLIKIQNWLTKKKKVDEMNLNLSRKKLD